MEAFEAYLLDLKDQYKSFYYHILKSDSGAAAVMIRLPGWDSEWTWCVFGVTRKICEEFPYAQPFFNVEEFPGYNLSGHYMGIDYSSYHKPEQFPPYLNHFAALAH